MAAVTLTEKQEDSRFIDNFINMPVTHIATNHVVARAIPTEIQCALSYGARPLALLILSPVMAKTLVEVLSAAVRDYETLTGTSVQSVREITDRAEHGTLE